MSLRIAILTDGITPFVTGGMQRHSSNLAKYFTKLGAQVTLVSCVPFDSNIPSEAEINKELFGNEEFSLYRCITLNFPKPGKIPGHYIRNSYKYSKQVFDSVDFKEIDFVYAKGFAGWYYMEERKKNNNLPSIGVKFHGYEMYQDLPSLKQRLEAKLLRKSTAWNNLNADLVFSYGGKITKLIERKIGVDKSKIVEFTSGLDKDWLRESELALPGPIKSFIFVGRNESRKGINELNESIKSLLKQNLKFKFSFVGPIPKQSQIQSEQIKYFGELNSKNAICDVLDQGDVLVCPSHAEGMPNVLLEAMARGLAIIATDVGAVEIVVDDSNGKLIRALDQKQLTNSIEACITTDENELYLKKKASWEKVNKSYLWAQIASDTLETITKFI